MPHLSIRLLGPIQVTLAGEPVTDFVTDKVRALLTYLAVEAHQPHRRESLAGLLWAEQPERSARANLRRALANLRRVIGDHDAEPPFLLIDRQTIQFNRASDAWVDVNAFTELLGSQETVHPLEEAVELCRGGFLEGFSVGDSGAFEEWSLLQREQLNRQVLAALHRLTDHYEASGDYEQALPHAWRQVELDRWQEDAHRQVMRLLALSGKRSTALAQYETMRRVLAEDLGIEPEAESTLLYEQIRSGGLESLPHVFAPVDIPERATRLVGECPYRGLAAFREADAPFFHGRDDFIARLVEAVRQQPMVAVIVGSSGSGKSSAVYAGLLPRLREEAGWLIVGLRPGAQPFHALAGALLAVLAPELNETDRLIEARRLAAALPEGEVLLSDAVKRALEKDEAANRLLLVVDQAEELYTLCPEPEMPRRFLDGLLAAVGAGSEQRTSPFVLLVTLRADFMGHALTHRAFADALQDASLMMGPMSRDELRLAIEQPAETQGAAFEVGLVERLLDDVGEEPGNLPLLEFALTLLWEGQTNGWLTHAGYEEIGRVKGALARYADEVFGELDERQRERARQVFEQLVRPGEGTEDSRRVAIRAEMGDENWALVQHLADKRLVVTGQDATGQETVEVVHEALIPRWGRLQTWMEEDRTFRTWQEGLRVALRGWEASDHDEGALLRGVPLAQAETWVAERDSELSESEREFIETGVTLRERSQAEGERRRRRTILALIGGLVIALALTIVAFNARSTAQREANVNRSLVLAADAEAAFANGEGDLALALALEAVDMNESPPGAQRALAAVALGPGTQAILEGHSHAVRDAALSPLAPLAVSGSCSEIDAAEACTRGELILWDLEKGAETARFEAHTDWINAVAFSPDSRTVVSGSGDATLILWDIASGREIRRFEGHDGGVNAVVFSPDGTTIVSGADDALLILWDIASGREIRRFVGHDGGVNAVAFSPDGTTIVSGADDALLIQWDSATAAEISRFEEHRNAVTDVVFYPSGNTILSVGSNLSLLAWDPETGESNRQDFGAATASLAIAPDGRTALVSVKVDLHQWDIERWQDNGRLAGHGTGENSGADIHSVEISSDGRLALSAGSDGTLRLWSLAGQTMVRHFAPDGPPIDAVAVNSDGSRLLTGLGTGETLLWDIADGRVIRRFGGGEGTGVGPDCLAFSPKTPEDADQRSALVCTEDATYETDATSLILWDVETAREVRRFEGHVTYVRALAFSPDGHSVLSGSQSLPNNEVGDLVLWDLATGREIRRFDIAHDVTSIAMSADGGRALTGSVTDFVAILWDVETGEEIRRFEGHELPVLNVAFGPEEKTVLTASFDGSLIRWDVETGEIIRRYTGHGAAVWGLDISPDGRFMASSSQLGTVILWDLKTGEELSRVTAHAGYSFDVAFHPNSETYFSVGVDGQLIEWLVPDQSLDKLVDWIHANRYVRDLTCAEREQYRLEPSNCQRLQSLP